MLPESGFPVKAANCPFQNHIRHIGETARPESEHLHAHRPVNFIAHGENAENDVETTIKGNPVAPIGNKCPIALIGRSTVFGSPDRGIRELAGSSGW